MAIADMIYAGVMAGVVAMAFILIYSIGFTITDDLEDKLNVDNPAINTTIQNIYDTLDTLDTTFAMFFFGVLTAVILIAWAVPVNPVVYGAVFVATIIFLLITPVVTNMYMEFAANINNVDVEAAFPYMFHIMENYPLYFTIFSFILVVVMISRWRLSSAD